ncbi:hypothetical protein ALC62_15067 [Cyphomyrmex costatus]|uniref:Uncharacterized protein n=1 Tax=Cyphomyrmex costatus TaxID=456900 RepID=A0A151I826_9HYME|nr:hypothetical protein ALC62_15067 [Cyphomyrmex costatus]
MSAGIDSSAMQRGLGGGETGIREYRDAAPGRTGGRKVFIEKYGELRGFPVTKVAHTARDRAAELQAEVRSAIRVLHGWCPRPPQGHARGETVLMSPQSQIRGNHGRNSGPPPPPPATVVVSSTSSMRPPPPPPPPRARTSNESKGHHEEPTSSIPDLGEEFVLFCFFFNLYPE